MSDSRAVLVVIGIIAVFILVGWLRLVERTIEMAEIEPVAVTEIQIRPGDGSVTVRTGDFAQTRIYSCVRYRGGAPRSVYHLDGTVLIVDTSCGAYCRVSFDIDAPAGVRVTGANRSGPLELTDVSAVDVRTRSGRITVMGASGPVTARSRSGPIHVYELEGDLTAESSSGTVEAAGVRSPNSRIQTSSGVISLGLDAPGSVSVQSASGDVRIAVPTDAYRVQAESSSGHVELGVSSATDAPHLLELRSSTGDITLVQR